MLLLRCSLLADSMSRSISFWPSTIATRSSSAWVALNSMRFMWYSPARSRSGQTGAADDARDYRAPVLTCGGQGRQRQTRPRGQHWLPGYEGSDAGSGHLGWQLDKHPVGAGAADLESVVAVLCVVAQTVWRLRGGALFASRAAGSLTGPPVGAVGCRIRCAGVWIARRAS